MVCNSLHVLALPFLSSLSSCYSLQFQFPSTSLPCSLTMTFPMRLSCNACGACTLNPKIPTTKKVNSLQGFHRHGFKPLPQVSCFSLLLAAFVFFLLGFLRVVFIHLTQISSVKPIEVPYVLRTE